MNHSGIDHAGLPCSTSSIQQLASHQVRQLVASGRLRDDADVLPRSTNHSIIIDGPPPESLEYPIRCPDDNSYVTWIDDGQPTMLFHDPFHLSSPGRAFFHCPLCSVGSTLPVRLVYEKLWWPLQPAGVGVEWLCIRYIVLPESWWSDDRVPEGYCKRFRSFLKDFWHPDDCWSEYQRELGSTGQYLILERVFEDPSRFAAVCRLHFSLLDILDQERFDCCGEEPNALWQAQVFTNKHPSTARISSWDLDYQWFHYERPIFVSESLLSRPEWDLLLYERADSQRQGLRREGPAARARLD